MTFKPALLLLCFLAAAVPGRAQAPAAPKEPPIEFRATAWNRDFPDLFYEVNGKPQPLALRRGTISPPQLVQGASPKLVLYKPTIIDGEPGKVQVGELTLNRPPLKNLIVVWLEKNGRYGATVLADEPGRPAAGQVRFVNLAGRPLALNCNGRTEVCAPGGEMIVAAQKGGVGIRVAVEVKSNGQWKLALMNGLPITANERVTAFIADPGKLALSPEEEEKEIKARPLSLFVIRDTVETP